ncbi:MAG: bifunctional 2-C-methyl-D-erythritol 4-phosphate cytidylyltransferase/2-C-methyl-D-erythritol 2,4-cyclodiphosphate synthase [Devosiaceae bacterium]|nr:bifunctional 2-C-methyl-D-erythritol 4-phosphate cytidylyltransferase/2-C-methyl-D-erythritol 2,4-cyclodiphosphate synthase [Devosiaceae bacterium]
MNKKIAIIIVAGGRGTRANTKSDDLPKQYKSINGVPVLKRTISKFLNIDFIDFIIPIIHKDDEKLYSSLNLHDDRLLDPIAGGKTRQLSVFEGLKALEKHQPDLVLIHDGARPFIEQQTVNNVVIALQEYQAVLPVTNVIDSIKRSSNGKIIGGSEDRTQLYAAQTPQGFHFESIYNAHKKAISFSDSFSDDSAIAEWAGIEVAMCEGSVENIKITTVKDFLRAERILDMRQIMETRVGTAYDVHQFKKGNEVILGGIKIPHNAKLKGHSDADAVLHVLTDAILGALALGDIGTHFPPSEKKWKGEPSTTFLKFAVSELVKRNGRINVLDVTIIAEQPKISPHTQKIRQSIANICNISIDRVSVKATTSESMGFLGRKEGLATMASATIELPRDK